jgi:hypothetical protein
MAALLPRLLALQICGVATKAWRKNGKRNQRKWRIASAASAASIGGAGGGALARQRAK